jgi:hypothetical protein
MTAEIKTVRSLAALVAGVIGTAPASASAAAGGFYLGADLVQLATELDYGYTEKYSTSHLRVRAGYQIADFIAVEGQVLTAGDDTDFDFTNNQFEFDSGTVIGVYAKPGINFRAASVYGLIGFSRWDTKYTFVAPAVRDADSVIMLGIGIGGEFPVTENLSFNIEGMYHTGSADYNRFFFGSIDVNSYGVAAGARFRF